jgi:ABC-type uncharacterized transport system substrate-binding protein
MATNGGIERRFISRTLLDLGDTKTAYRVASAADLVRREVDIIVAVATPAAHAAKSATATIPIVMAVADPLATGLVASPARPGSNLTGVSTTSPDLAGKRLQLLRELRPGLGRVAFLGAAMTLTRAPSSTRPMPPTRLACTYSHCS